MKWIIFAAGVWLLCGIVRACMRAKFVIDNPPRPPKDPFTQKPPDMIRFGEPPDQPDD